MSGLIDLCIGSSLTHAPIRECPVFWVLSNSALRFTLIFVGSIFSR